ncbi:PSP1 domain protein [Solidesulfovibrio carbinoliphilus subsp. oakridgensis]|uniref:PSP1 domain protein n=1 Tax=Solidesulfovibrio carbinoliphilus subsp. oakridgensis TaxID=694327 RepID=G7Q6J8_9BACT|nr:stage 0 sporulation family protein [Solidesulfovibrio carbinoliphilus]EHJ47611.1 PSP1 domain protein [Solidesulfovibrio carbinoliphilus subsp. oakridgensis]
MSHILGLKFRDHGQVYYFDSGPFVVAVGDSVLVQTEQGLGMGKVTLVRDTPPEDGEQQEIKPIFRLPTPEDLEIERENDALAREARTYCRKCIETRALEMKLVDVEVLHDRGKIVFYFTAPGRIDFRELVKDLVKAYHTRIELRQIGVRHETQMLGAIGNCGQMCCCRRFMRKFAPVTIKMAKEQNLFLNPTKISGICGRLLCCLSFEQENYEQFQKKCPRVGKKFSTSLGTVKVLRTNLFRETVTVLDEAGEERELTVEEWGTVVEARLPSEGQAQPRPAEPGRPETARPEGGRPEGGRPEGGRSDSRRGEGSSHGRPEGRGEGRDRSRPSGAGGPQASPSPAPSRPAGPSAGPEAGPQAEREPGSRPSRRGRRPSRKNPRQQSSAASGPNPGSAAGQHPGQDPTQTQAPGQGQRQRRPRPESRPDTRPGGKPSSRDPETGS